MKVTIDTKEDSYEDIRKVLHILTQILERKGEHGSGEAINASNFDTTNLMSIFDRSTGDGGLTKATDANSLLNLNKPEKKEEMTRVEVYE